MERKLQWKIYNINIMSEVIIIIFCYTILFISIIYLAYSNYSTYVKAPLYLLCIFILTYITYVVATYWSEPMKDPNNPDLEQKYPYQKNFFDIIQRVFIIYGEYILIIIGLFLVLLVMYKIFIGAIVYSLSKSIWLSLGFIVLFLALVKNTFYESLLDSDNRIIILIRDFIFYIPCLITDSIDFLIKDYSNTPNSTIIVFIMIVIYFIIFFLMPLINTDGGHLLLVGPQTLDMIKSLSTKDILIMTKTPIPETKTDFVYKTQESTTTPAPVQKYLRDKLTNSIETFVNTDDAVTHADRVEDEAAYSYNVKSNVKVKSKVKSDASPLLFEPQKYEGSYLGSLVEKDTNYNYKFNSNYGKKIKDPQAFDIKEMYNTISQKLSKQWEKITNKTKEIKTKLIGPSIVTEYKYNYGLSFWLYINTFHFNQNAAKMQTVLTYGDKLHIMYDNIENELIILLEEKEKYKTKGILYQRWNHIVVNSRDSNLDIFINNNLVGTYRYKNASFVNVNDTLMIGSTENSNFGSICNFRYYKNILDLSKILSLYRKYNKKNPPI